MKATLFWLVVSIVFPYTYMKCMFCLIVVMKFIVYFKKEDFSDHVVMQEAYRDNIHDMLKDPLGWTTSTVYNANTQLFSYKLCSGSQIYTGQRGKSLHCMRSLVVMWKKSRCITNFWVFYERCQRQRRLFDFFHKYTKANYISFAHSFVNIVYLVYKTDTC